MLIKLSSIVINATRDLCAVAGCDNEVDFKTLPLTYCVGISCHGIRFIPICQICAGDDGIRYKVNILEEYDTAIYNAPHV